MYQFDTPLTTTQIISHWSFKNIVGFPTNTASDIINFLRSITKNKLLIENLKFLCSRIDDERIHNREFEPYWGILLEHLGISPQPNFTNFELLTGMHVYYYVDKIRAATEYNFFIAIKEKNDANQLQLANAIESQKVEPINYYAMYEQALLAQKHGTPGHVLIGSLCFWIATYCNRVIKNEPTAVRYYQLAVQNLYCAHILKDHCTAAIANARFSPNKEPPPITNEYGFFFLLAAVEAGRVELMIQHIQGRAGTLLLGKLEVSLAKQDAIRAATQFIRDTFAYHPEVPVTGDGVGCAGPASSISVL